MDYAIKRGVSLSTLRRHIKADKIEYRLENGRYLVVDDGKAYSKKKKPNSSVDTQKLQTRLSQLEIDLMKAQEEIAELKTLIALYEEKIPDHLDC